MKNNDKKEKKIVIFTGLFIAILLAILIIFINNQVNDKNYEIQKIESFSYFKLYENGKYGVIDTKGNILVPPNYEFLEIPNPSKPVFICYTNYSEKQVEVKNEKNENILTSYNSVLPIMFKDALATVPYEKSVLTYKENEKYGLIDYEGKRITKPIYDSIESLLYKEGCLVVEQNRKYGVINIRGKQMLEINYDSINADGYYEEDTKYKMAGFIVGNKLDDGYRYGYIDNNGKTILQTEYNEIQRVTDIRFENGIYLIAIKNGQAGVYRNDKQIIKHGYEHIDYNKQTGLFTVQKNSKYGVFNKDGNEVLSLDYDSITMSEDNIIAIKDEITYYFDKEGKEIVQNSSKSYIKISNENYVITVSEENKYGIENKEGNIILGNEYNYIEFAYNTYFIVNKNEKIGVFDAYNRDEIISGYSVIQKIDGKEALQAILDNTSEIEIYNANMEKVYSMKEAVLINESDYIKLYSKTDRKYFDKKGNLIENKNLFTRLELYAFEENNKWGFKDKMGNVKIDAVYDMVTELNSYGFAGIKQNGKWGVINSLGKIIVEPTYELEFDEPEFIGVYCKINPGYGMIYYTKDIKNEK